MKISIAFTNEIIECSYKDIKEIEDGDNILNPYIIFNKIMQTPILNDWSSRQLAVNNSKKEIELMIEQEKFQESFESKLNEGS